MPQAPSKAARRRPHTKTQAPRAEKSERAKAQSANVRASMPGAWWALGVASMAAFVIFAVLAYALDWEWTGFPGNTLWDWLQLLLVPLALNAATIWYSGGGRLPLGERRLFRLGLGIALMLVVLIVIAAAYRFRWAWTGFLGQPAAAPAPASSQPKTLWDWLNMLLLPCAVAIATIQFSRRRQQPTEKLASRT